MSKFLLLCLLLNSLITSTLQAKENEDSQLFQQLSKIDNNSTFNDKLLELLILNDKVEKISEKKELTDEVLDAMALVEGFISIHLEDLTKENIDGAAGRLGFAFDPKSSVPRLGKTLDKLYNILQEMALLAKKESQSNKDINLIENK